MLLSARDDVRTGSIGPRLAGLVAWVVVSSVSAAAAQATPPAQPQPVPDAGAATPARPPGPPTREARQAAAAAYARGQQAYQAGDFAAAEAAFLEAYAAVPNPVVLVGVGESRDAAGNVIGALEAFEQYLAERPNAPDAAAIRTRIETLRGRIGRLSITSTPAGAAIAIDDVPTEHVTPAEITLPTGSHAVALTLEGHLPQERTVDLQPGETPTEVAITLEAEVVEPEPEPVVEEPPPAEPEEPTEGYTSDADGPSVVTWIAASIAAAGIASGTVLGFLALSEEGEFHDMPTAAAADRGERYALFADVAFGIGAAAAITTLVLYFVRDHDRDVPATDHARVRVRPVASHRDAGLRAEVQF